MTAKRHARATGRRGSPRHANASARAGDGRGGATPGPIKFIESTLVDPETGKLFVLTDAERAFLRRAFALGPDGRMLQPELVFSGPKKSGKTALAAMCVIYAVRVLGGRFAEAYCVANDLEQAQSRVFRAAARIVAASPVLAAEATIGAERITFRSTSATIDAISTDYAGAAGANPCITSFDEIWGIVSERGHRLFDEMVPVPTRRISCRLVTSYAGFENESGLLEGLNKRGLKGKEIAPDLYEQPGMLMFWTNAFSAPWQTEAWREQMREALRPNQYLRMIENRWVSSESAFIEMEWWDRCVDPARRPMVADGALPVWLGVDASVKRDSTAIVACTWDAATKLVRLVAHRVFQPSARDPIDFEQAVEGTILDWRTRFRVREVRYDPYQMQAVAQRLAKANVPMVEFAQTVGNLTEASNNLYELVKGGNLLAYPDAAIRLAVQRTVAVESSRGWKLDKSKQSHRIDAIVALAMAALAAVQGGVSGILGTRGARRSSRLRLRHLLLLLPRRPLETLAAGLRAVPAGAGLRARWRPRGPRWSRRPTRRGSAPSASATPAPPRTSGRCDHQARRGSPNARARHRSGTRQSA